MKALTFSLGLVLPLLFCSELYAQEKGATIQFHKAQPKPGLRWRQLDSFTIESVSKSAVNGRPGPGLPNRDLTKDYRFLEVEVLKVHKGTVTQFKVSFKAVYTLTRIDDEKPKKKLVPLSYRSFLVELGNGQKSVTDHAGKAVDKRCAKAVLEETSHLFREAAIVQALPDRALKMGEKIKLKDKAAQAILGFGEAMKTEFTLTLMKTQRFHESPCAVFALSVDAKKSEAGEQSEYHLKGELIVELATKRLRKFNLYGPSKLVSQSLGQKGRKLTINSSGSIELMKVVKVLND